MMEHQTPAPIRSKAELLGLRRLSQEAPTTKEQRAETMVIAYRASIQGLQGGSYRCSIEGGGRES